jgi:hypothetical protein
MIYTTWYEFKKDLEKRLGYSLLNWRWLEVKPRCPLPWDDSQMKAVILAQVKGKKTRKNRRRDVAIN